MDSNAVKVWLSNYRDLSCRRDALIDELHHLMDVSTRTSAVLTGMPRAKRHTGDGFSNTAIEMGDGKEKLQTLIAHIDESLKVRLYLIDRLTDERYRLVLTLRYINGLEWFKVEHAMHYERRQVFYFHKAAIEEMGAILDEEKSLYLDFQKAI